MRSDRSRRFIMLALAVAFLATSLLAAAPSASAQIWLGSRDETFGWTFPSGEFPGATVDDPSGDQAMEAEAGAVPIASAGVYRSMDLVALRVDEPDAETLRFQIDVDELDAHKFLAENILFGSRLEVSFAIGGHDFDISGYLWTSCKETVPRICEGYTDPGLYYNAVLYQGSGEERETLGRLPTQVLIEDARIEVLVPRWALDRSGAGTAPFAGDDLTRVRAETRAGGFCFGVCTQIVDKVPDTAHIDRLHTLTIDSNGARVGFADGIAEADSPNTFYAAPLVPRALNIDVDPVGAVRFPLTIENRADHKVLLQPAVVAEDGAALSASVPTTLEIPAGAQRKLMVTLNESTTLTPDAPLDLIVSFKVLGSSIPAQDQIRVTLRAVPPLSIDQNKLYFHTRGEDNVGLSEHGVDTFRISRGFLSTMQDDPLDHGKGAVLHSYCLCINNVWGWSGEARLTSPLTLSNETPLVYHLTVDAPVAGSLDLSPSLFLDDLLVSHTEQTVELAQGENTVAIESFVSDDALELESGKGPFYLDLFAAFRPGGVFLGELVGIAEPVDPRLKVQGASWIEFPITEAAAREPAAAHLVVERTRDTDKVQYVNPGRSTLWNVTITNQANEEDTVTVDTQVPEGWAKRVAPDNRFKIGPGESVTVGVFITAPADAKEGDTARLTTTVASSIGDGATSGLPLVAVVTKGVTVGDPHYVPDNATRERAQSAIESKESPGIGILPILGLAAILLKRPLRRRTFPRPRSIGAGSHSRDI